MATWRFYGRKQHLHELNSIFERKRWFFLKITGRRRIGKTTLIQQALQSISPARPIFYLQLPDSEPAGLVSAFRDALDTFHISGSEFSRPNSLVQLAKLIGLLVENGYIVVLDEFQYLHRKGYEEFFSHLQSIVDDFSRKTEAMLGGLIVLGSIHAEMTALLEDRSSPLFGRITDAIEINHLDIASILEIIRDHAADDPNRLLFLWALFEGVPKFYRDCFERDVLNASRQNLLRKVFFESSSPLRSEADNWFLRELRGRYDVVLKYVARHPGCRHSDLVQAIEDNGGGDKAQIGGYLQGLVERYRLIEKKLPIFADPKTRKSRYYLADNFLQAWLCALSGPVSARTFRPLEQLVTEADDKLAEVEGYALEKLTRQIYEERSRLGVGDFSVTTTIQGFWNRSNIEIDLIACNEHEKIIRFISCKRSAQKLIVDATNLQDHASRFLKEKAAYKDWKIEYAGVTPTLKEKERSALKAYGIQGQSLSDLTCNL